jgi:hypothetical protein
VGALCRRWIYHHHPIHWFDQFICAGDDAHFTAAVINATHYQQIAKNIYQYI